MSKFAVATAGSAAAVAPFPAPDTPYSTAAILQATGDDQSGPFAAKPAQAQSRLLPFPLLTRDKGMVQSVAGAFNDYSTTHLGIDFRAFNPAAYAEADASSPLVAGGMALARADDAAEEGDAIDEATSVRSDPPPPPEHASLLKRVLTYYINTPAISVPTIEMTVFAIFAFAIFASALHYAVSLAATQGDPTIEPEFFAYSPAQVAKLGLSFLGVATLFFGSNAYPEFMRPAVGKVVGLTKYLERPLKFLGSKLQFGSKSKAARIASLPGEALHFTGEMLADPAIREKGFILGASQEIRSRYDTPVLEHPFLGSYTTGDLRVWGAEFMINGGIIYPLVALSLGIPFLETVAPALGISLAATLSSARMSMLWGEDEEYRGRIVLGRTAIFAFANTVAPLAATLLKSGAMSASGGYLIQLGLTTVMSLGAMGLIRPPKDSRRPPVS